MNFWRAVGLNYVQYSNISARLVRKSLKPSLQADALKRDVVNIKFTKWEAGKPVGNDLNIFPLALIRERSLMTSCKFYPKLTPSVTVNIC